MNSFDFIDRRRSGTSTKEILDEIEGDVDVTLVRAKLLKDLKSVTAEDIQVSLSDGCVVINSLDSDAKMVVDTYTRVYPEINFLFEVPDNTE